MPDRQEWSVRGDGSRTDWAGQQVVVFVPDDGELELGYAWLRRELEQGAPVVRLIGCGVTVRESWPSWLTNHPRAAHAILTEVDAYLPCDRAGRLESLATEVDHWLDSVLSGEFGAVDVTRAFRSTFTNRVLLQHFSAWTLLEGIAFHHSSDRVVSPDARWQKWLAPATKASRASHAWFALRLLAWVALLFWAGVSLRVREFLIERPSRKKLAGVSRSAAKPTKAWIGVIASWPYASRHALEVVKAFDGAFGVLLQDTLKPGIQDAHFAGKVEAGNVVFPTLGQPALLDRFSELEQVVSSATARGLVGVMLRSLGTSFRATLRAARLGPRLGIFSLSERIAAVARVLTIDVLRATEARAATCILLRRRDFSGARIVWPHASAPSVTVPDLMLQAAGATTVELVHGAFADRQGVLTYAFSASSIRATWTREEVRFLEPHLRGQACCGGFVPRAAPASERAHRPVARVLALTNYGAGVLGPRVTLFSRLGYCQQAFFEALDVALRDSGRQLEVVWRPHPADDDRSFAPIMQRYPSLRLSRGERGLEEDLDAADIVVSSWSSALVEALRHPVPVFVHSIPYYEASGVLSAFDRERTFTSGDSLSVGFTACLSRLDINIAEALEPERRLRVRFFGEAGVPCAASVAMTVMRAAQ